MSKRSGKRHGDPRREHVRAQAVRELVTPPKPPSQRTFTAEEWLAECPRAVRNVYTNLASTLCTTAQASGVDPAQVVMIMQEQMSIWGPAALRALAAEQKGSEPTQTAQAADRG